MAASKINEILKKAASEIRPEKSDYKEVQEVLGEISAQLKKMKADAKVALGGSFAKGTFLKNDHDVDIFVMFGKRHAEDDLSGILEKALKKFSPERVHGSRDYFHVKNRLSFEIIPVMELKKPEDAKNVTDFSPLHVNWFLKNGAKYKEDVMLAKKFCKSAGAYGAESYVNGFSGHVIDILVVYYKGFMPLLKASARWKKKQVIDFYNRHKGNALFDLNKAKTQGNLIVIDPVQPDRNAAASLSDEKLGLFVSAAKKFLKSPSEKFFQEKKIDIEALLKKGAIVIEAEPLEGKEDVSGAKLLKAFEFARKGLSEFGINESGWQWKKKGNALFWYIPKISELSAEKEWQGPPAEMKKMADEFRKKYKKTFIRAGRVYAIVKRKHTSPKSLAKELAEDKYFRERTGKCWMR